MHREYRTAIATGYTKERFLAVQCDAHGTNPGEGFSPMMFPFGFLARNLDPDNEGGNYKGAIVATDTEGTSEQFSWVLHDVRLASKLPPMTKGSSALYNSAGAFVLLDVDAEVELHYVPQGANKAHAVTIGKTSTGKSVITLQHADNAFLMLDETSAQMRGPGSAYVEVLADAVNINGNQKILGSLGIGGAAGVIPAALATPLQTYLTGLEVALQALATAIDGKMPSSPGVALGALNTALGAIAAAKAATASQFLTTA